MKTFDTELETNETATTSTTHTAARSPAVGRRLPSPAAIAQAADALLFAARKKGGRRIAARTEKLRKKFEQLWFLDFGVPPFMDLRDIVPAAQSLVGRMTNEGGAGFVHAVHHNGHPDRLSGFVLSDNSIEPERRRFARATGARLRDLRVHCAKAGANISLRLSSQIMPALSTNPAHPPMTVATGALQRPYDKVASSLAELTTTRTASSVIDSVPPKKLGMTNGASNATESETANGRQCLDCGKPIGERGNRAVYCKQHGTKAARRKFRKQEAQAQAGRASNGSGATGPAQSAGRSLSTSEAAASNGARPVARQNNHATRRDNGVDVAAPAVLEIERRRRSYRTDN